MADTPPTARIIHNLARTGGTVIGKCLGSMAGVVLLSEINPRGLNRFNPVDQARRWFDLLSDEDLAAIGDPKGAPLDMMIERIDARVRDRGSQLVIRDWTHLDFVAAPFLEEPTNRLSLADALAGRFEITQIEITRHPLDQTESILRTWSGESMPPLDTFLTAERRYAELISPIGFVR